jgi:hypothetical protein
MEGRSIGLDVHRDFCEVAICDGGKVRRAARVVAQPEPLKQFAEQLGPQDRVALEATGNALAIARLIRPHVNEVVIVNTRRLKAISEAKHKTDRHDARMLAQLLAAGYWMAPGSLTSRPARCAVASPGVRGWSRTARAARTRSSPCCIATSRRARR